MFNPHIHQQQQQQQQQFHQHLRQLQQLFQQQQPPPPPPPQPAPAHHVPHHHHQTPRGIPVPPQSAPSARMVNLCQATQTTIIAPNPMLQGALLMQQMQGNMRGFAMGGQQFRQFFAAGTRSSLLGPVPMGVAIKSPMMGFPAARPFHPHVRYYNNNNNNTPTATTTTASSSSTSSSTSTSISTTDITSRPSDRKRDGEQMAAESSNDQPEASTSTEANDKTEIDNAAGGGEGSSLPSEETLGEPVVKKPRTEGPEEPKEQSVVETQTVPVAETITLEDADGELLSSDCNSQLEDCVILDGGSAAGSDVVELDLLETKAMVHSCPPAVSPPTRLSEEVQEVNLPSTEMTQEKDICLTSSENQEEAEEGVAEGTSKFYCYLCSITCHNQQNFRSHMNSVSHQQRMMEIQHMSNACLVTLLPRVQESLQGTSKDGEKKSEFKRWCSTCETHFSSSIMDHRRTKEHKLVSRTAISSCTICKKHFRTSQIFIEHLQSQEHRQKVEKLQENEGCEDSAKLTVMDTEGFLVEEEEGSEVEEEEEEEEEEEKDDRPSNEGDQDEAEKRDGWTSFKEVTLKNMDHDEQYDPDTVYGSSFFVPVAGFICRLCKKFYHFESSSLHSHCKSLKHFENLKKYKTLTSQKGEAVESCKESVQAQDSVSPVPESNTDWSDNTSLDSGLNSVQPIITLPQMTQEPEKQQESNVSLVDPSPTSPLSSTHCTDHGLHSMEDEPTSQDSVDQKGPPDSNEEAADSKEEAADSKEEPADSKEEPADSKEEPADSKEEPAPDPTADSEGNEEQQEGEVEPVVVQGKKNSTGKAKAAPKRRSGRAANRR